MRAQPIIDPEFIASARNDAAAADERAISSTAWLQQRATSYLGSATTRCAHARSLPTAATSLRSDAGLVRLKLRCFEPRAHQGLIVYVRALRQQRLHHVQAPMHCRPVKHSSSLLRRSAVRGAQQ
jgi:hypothetical protein